VLFIRSKTSHVIFQTFVDHFHLVVGIRVIGDAHVHLGALQFKQLLPKCVGEIQVMIRNKKGGHAMQLETMIKENLCY
jgi:hypothetical protein